MKWLTAVLVCWAAVVASAEEAVYRVTGGHLPVAHACNGFAQDVQFDGDGVVVVHVATSLSPIGADGRYVRTAGANSASVPDDFQLPERLDAELRATSDSWTAATRVLEWAAAAVEVATEDRRPQDAQSVLARGYGRCSGLANAAVALLLASGFEARTVSGVLVGADGRAVPHRWIECRLPGAGWVASDPTLGLWAVTPRHIVFPTTVDQMPSIEIVASGDDGLHRLPRRGGVVVRPNRGADLLCRLPHAAVDPPPMAVLRGGGGEVRRSLLDPEARFAGLLPGRWILEVETALGVVERRELVLKSGDVRVYTVDSIEPKERGGSGS